MRFRLRSLKMFTFLKVMAILARSLSRLSHTQPGRHVGTSAEVSGRCCMTASSRIATEQPEGPLTNLVTAETARRSCAGPGLPTVRKVSPQSKTSMPASPSAVTTPSKMTHTRAFSSILAPTAYFLNCIKRTVASCSAVDLSSKRPTLKRLFRRECCCNWIGSSRRTKASRMPQMSMQRTSLRCSATTSRLRVSPYSSVRSPIQSPGRSHRVILPLSPETWSSPLFKKNRCGTCT
mmetsp:Transcript_49926/g.132705  ORF Transcript_49926/g.132705 Transcript_49926/m.132705 type:complete len:235 (-) Transcript_49926:708-1412(-)